MLISVPAFFAKQDMHTYHRQEVADLVLMVALTVQLFLEKCIVWNVIRTILLMAMVVALHVVLIVQLVKGTLRTVRAVTLDNILSQKSIQDMERLLSVNLMHTALLLIVPYVQTFQQMSAISVTMDTIISRASVSTVSSHVADVVTPLNKCIMIMLFLL